MTRAGTAAKQRPARTPVDGIVKERRWPFAIVTSLWVAGAFILASVIVGAAGYVAGHAGLRLADANILNAVLYAASTGLAVVLIIGAPRLLRLWSGKIGLARLLGFRRLLQWRDILYAAIGYVVSYAALILVGSLAALVPGFNANQPQNTGFSMTLAPGDALVVFVSLVVIAPVLEEIIFRGYLFGTLRRSVPVWAAAIITSLLFGLAHGQWNVGIDVFLLSLVSCYLRYRTGSLWASILLHVLKNGVATYLLYVAGHAII